MAEVKKEVVQMDDATKEQLKTEIFKLKFDINDLQKEFFNAKLDSVKKDRIILELLVNNKNP